MGRVTGIDLGRGAPGGSVDRTRPGFGPVRLSARRVRAGKTITIRYSLTEPATVTLSLERVLAGRKVGRRCVAPKRSNRAPATLHPLPQGEADAHASPPSRPARARSASRRGSSAGPYRLSLRARDTAGNRSKRLVTHIDVLRRARG